MSSLCPKCHDVVDEDIVCCADVKISWKCQKCGKLSTGFAFPFGRCPLCGGNLSRADLSGAKTHASIEAVQTALQFEMSAATFYRLAAERAKNADARHVFANLAEFEDGHRVALEEKYHVHRDPSEHIVADRLVEETLFTGVASDDPTSQAGDLFDLAIKMEHRTKTFFEKKVEEMPPGPERELYRELAAEEVEHIALLESERDKILG